MAEPRLKQRRRRRWGLVALALVTIAGVVAYRASRPGESRPASSATSVAAPASSAPAAVTPPPLVTAAAETPSRRDRFATIPAIAEIWWPAAPGATTRQRARLVHAAADTGPVVRVVEEFTRDPAVDSWTLREQVAMRADAVMVAVPPDRDAHAVTARLHAAGFATEPARASDAVVVVRLPEATLDAVPAALARLLDTVPELAAEPDYLRFPSDVIPNDYNVDRLWGLANIDAPGAWTVTTGANDVVVAILDSGMDGGHPDLVPNLWTNPGEIAGNNVDDDGNGFVDDIHGWDFAANRAQTIDNDGHGTHVAGTIGAVGNNNFGVTGVAWNVRLLPLRCGDGTFPDSTLTNALRYLIALRNRGVRLVAINASLGGSGFNSALRTEIASAGTAGILFVAAAGNDGTNNDVTPVYPASYDVGTILAVASLHQGNGLSGFSDYGRTSVDLAAPGTEIYSTKPNATYGHNSGTSMAAPHVAGAIALVAAANPGLNATQLRARILDTVDPVPALTGLIATGGRLNVRRAVAPALLRPHVAITTPAARVAVLERAGLDLALAATLLPDTGGTAAATLAWDAPEGPAAVGFSHPAGASTTVSFSAPGRYRVRVRAVAGSLEASDTIVVVVGPGTGPDAAGLRAWWRFDEESGSALDSSGDGRTGGLNLATRGPGVAGSGMTFNGSLSNVAFAAPAVSRVTIAGWANATGAGNSIFPRVVHMRPGLLFFGLDATSGGLGDDGNRNTLKFALDDGTTTPVWHTPPGTIFTHQWYHVAVTYDPAAAAPAPRFYINGVPQDSSPQGDATSATPTVPAGQGFLGDRGDGTRVWQGTLDEVRIYDRELGAAEVALLARETTVRALTEGYLLQQPNTDPLRIPLAFVPVPMDSQLPAPALTSATWTAGGGATIVDTGLPAFPELAAPGPGTYPVRFDGTTADGVHVVRTLDVEVITEDVVTDGYYTGTTANGVFALIVNGANGRFFGAGDRGVHGASFTLTSWGAFHVTIPNGAGTSSIHGRVDAAGNVTGFVNGVAFTGTRLTSGLGADDPARDGDYAGWVLDSGIRATAHVERGRVALVVREAGAQRAAEGVLGATGDFALAPAMDATFTGQVAADRLTADIALPGKPARRLVLLRQGYVPTRRLSNLSLRGVVGTGEAVLIPGFVVQGSGTLPMLVRGVGPGLEAYDVPGFLAQPRLELFQVSTSLAQNLGWASAPNAAEIVDTTARLQAFALDPARLDSAVLLSLSSDNYTATITGADGGVGVALAEAYDARVGDETVGLVNLSGRGHVGSGDNILIGGFVLAGDGPALVLVRGIGPGLAAYQVAGAIAQPVLTVFRGQTAIASGTAWSAGESATEVATAASQSGAFPLAIDAADAAILLYLEPGNYTAHVTGANGTTGIALVEIYLVAEF